MFFQVLELETYGKEHVLCIEVDVDNFIKPSVRALYTRYRGNIVAGMGCERCTGGTLT